jgi:hypothetical protein
VGTGALGAVPAIPGHGSLDKPLYPTYLCAMEIIRRTLEIDVGTDARLTQMAAERGQDVAAVIAEAVALLDSVVELAGPDIAEDRRRLDEFVKTRKAVPLDSVKAWVASWDTTEELPRPSSHKIG